jgi:cobalamin-dependent methionine synthase I
MLARSDIRARAVFRFFPAKSDGQRLVVYDSDSETALGDFQFGRSKKTAAFA